MIRRIRLLFRWVLSWRVHWPAVSLPDHTEQGLLFGGLLGAGTGAVVGHALGNTGAGAAIGAGVGALSGAAMARNGPNRGPQSGPDRGQARPTGGGRRDGPRCRGDDPARGSMKD